MHSLHRHSFGIVGHPAAHRLPRPPHPAARCPARHRVAPGLGFGLGALLGLWAVQGFCQGQADDAVQWRIQDRGLHHRTWEYVVLEPGPSGQPHPRTNTVTELATGLHHLREGQLLDSSPELEITATGAQALHALHQLRVLGNLKAPGAVAVTLPTGQELRTSVLGVSYQDASGAAVMIAEVKECQGQLLPSRTQILFPDALDDLAADVLYENHIHGVEQSLIFRGPLPSPAEWGLDPETAVVQIITEFLDRPTPQVTDRESATGRDVQVRFGGMDMPGGHAFALGREAERIPVQKQWLVTEDGRTCLIEQVPFREAAARLEAGSGEPDRSASLRPKPDRTTRLAALPRRLPPPGNVHPPAALVTLAKADLAGPGFLVDYTLLNHQTNLTLHPFTYYYLNGTVNVTSNLTIGPNVVVKVADAPTATIIASNVIWKTTDWAPAVFTAKDDNTVGDGYVPLPGSTGNPGLKFYGGVVLDLSAAASPVVSHARFCYLSNAVAASQVTFENVQFLDCYRAVAPGASAATLRNVLLNRVGTFLGGNGVGGDIVRAENVTAHFCTNFIADSSAQSYLTNCLFVCVTNWAGATTVTNATAVLNSDAGVFQIVGAGRHYLAQASPFRDAGTAQIHPGLLATLRQRTTWPPLVYSNLTISADTTFYPQAQRDTDAVDLGFHYQPLDHVFGKVSATAHLTFAPGTAAGWFRDSSGWYHAGHGINLANSKSVTFDGRVDAPCYWVRYNTVQEGGPGVWAGGYGPGGITGWASTRALAPTVTARFLRCSVLGGEGGAGNHFRDDSGYLIVRSRDCEFWGGAIGGYVSAQYHTNALFAHTSVWLEGGMADNHFIFRHCTFEGGQLHINRYSGTRTLVMVRDCALDGTPFPVADALKTDPTVSDYDYNAVLAGAPRPTNSGPNLVVVTNSFQWQTGPLGRYYLPANSPLIDSGSVSDAAQAGLYHYTTQTNQTKELNTRVDIGRHRVAVDRVRFIGVDDTTQGNWKGVYGSEGYQVINDASAYPTYASVTPSGNSTFTWSSAPTDVRALERGASGRIAACWYNGSYFDVTLTHTDGNPHRVAIYCLDWDTTTRAQTIDVLDPVSLATLDSRSVASFNGGKYLVWDVVGSVKFRFTRTGGYNAVISGIFFDPGVAHAVDGDGDLLADYWEDGNGDGSAAGDPTSWLLYDSPNGLSPGTGLEVFTPLGE